MQKLIKRIERKKENIRRGGLGEILSRGREGNRKGMAARDWYHSRADGGLDKGLRKKF